jgi:hypothetical protein
VPMPALNAATFDIDLKPAKTHGLADLGVPLDDSTEVKKGKLGEAMQMLDGGKIGRRYQNLKATLLKATEGGQVGAKLVLTFEIFGDDNTTVGAPSAVSARLLAGGQTLAELPLGSPYLPYGSCWYENHFAAHVPLEAFATADRVQLLAAADEVRPI